MHTEPVLPAEDPMYPSSDGLPLAENDILHFRDPATGAYLLTLAEANARIAELEARLKEQ